MVFGGAGYYDLTIYQIGLVSFGLEPICAGGKNYTERTGIYTKVKNYLPWIKSKLKK